MIKAIVEFICLFLNCLTSLCLMRGDDHIIPIVLFVWFDRPGESSHVNCVSMSGQLSRDVIGCFKSNCWLSRDVIGCWFIKSCCYWL